MADCCKKLLVLCLAVFVTRSGGAPASTPANLRQQLPDAVNVHAREEEKSEEWNTFRIRNYIDSDSGHHGKGAHSGGNNDHPPQDKKKNHQIFHQGINMDVSKMLDDLETLVVRLYRKIYGHPSVDKWQSSRHLVGDPRHRVSTIVRELVMMFPQVVVRHKRSLLNQSQDEGSDAQNGSFSSRNDTINLNGSDYQTFDETVKPLQFWFHLGSDVANFWRSSMYSISRRILQTNITGEWLSTLNEYLVPFKVHIGTHHQYKESNSASLATNTTRRQLFTRQKRYIDEDFSHSRFGKKLLSSGSGNRVYDYRDDHSDESLARRGERRSYYTDDGLEHGSLDRDDGYTSHDSYGGHGYAKLDPYVVLGVLAACVFIGAMVLSLYCKMDGSPCCVVAEVAATDPPPTVTAPTGFDDGGSRTEIPFFFGLPPSKKKYDQPWAFRN